MLTVTFKSLLLWSLLVVLAITNGILREKVLAPALGQSLALPASGVLFSLVIVLYTWAVIPWLGVLRVSAYWAVGMFWLLLTIVFEFVFGHYVIGNPWETLLKNYDVTGGNLWVLVLVATAISPYVAARLRGFT